MIFNSHPSPSSGCSECLTERKVSPPKALATEPRCKGAVSARTIRVGVTSPSRRPSWRAGQCRAVGQYSLRPRRDRSHLTNAPAANHSGSAMALSDLIRPSGFLKLIQIVSIRSGADRRHGSEDVGAGTTDNSFSSRDH